MFFVSAQQQSFLVFSNLPQQRFKNDMREWVYPDLSHNILRLSMKNVWVLCWIFMLTLVFETWHLHLCAFISFSITQVELYICFALEATHVFNSFKSFAKVELKFNKKLCNYFRSRERKEMSLESKLKTVNVTNPYICTKWFLVTPVFPPFQCTKAFPMRWFKFVEEKWFKL